MVKMAKVPNRSPDSVRCLSASQLALLQKLSELIPKTHTEMQGIQNSQTVLKKEKNKGRGLTLIHFKIYCKATLIRNVWHGYSDRHAVRSVEQN